MQNLQDQLKTLKTKGTTLNNQAIKLNTEIENSQAICKELEQKAIQLFGTSDINELKQKLKEIEEKNAIILENAQKDIANLEKELIEKHEAINQIKNK